MLCTAVGEQLVFRFRLCFLNRFIAEKISDIGINTGPLFKLKFIYLYSNYKIFCSKVLFLKNGCKGDPQKALLKAPSIVFY